MQHIKRIDKKRLAVHSIYDNNYLGIWKDNNMKKLFVIGDIHGDFYAFKQVLEMTECVTFDNINIKDIFKFNSDKSFLTLKDGCDFYKMNENIKWNKKMRNVYIVFAGDLVDRCRNVGDNGCINTINDENCDLKILKLIFDLDKAAQQYNSRVLMVLGNHEILNLDGDFRYVSFKGLYKNSNPLQKIDRVKEMNALVKQNISNIYGIIQINNHIIVHGGINYLFFKNEILNDESLNKIQKFNLLLQKFINDGDDNGLFNNEQSPFWDRTLGLDNRTNETNCNEIFENNILNIEKGILPDLKIIVAHCPQFLNKNNFELESRGINLSDCNIYKDRIWRIDVGMSRAWDKYKTIKNSREIKTLLEKLDYALQDESKFPDKLEFYSIHEKNSRKASILLIDNNNEVKKEDKLVLDYFYNNIFKENQLLIYTYLLQDLYLYLHSEYVNIFSKEDKLDCCTPQFDASQNKKKVYIYLLKYINKLKKKYILRVQQLNII
jgi:hypothetical protein